MGGGPNSLQQGLPWTRVPGSGSWSEWLGPQGGPCQGLRPPGPHRAQAPGTVGISLRSVWLAAVFGEVAGAVPRGRPRRFRLRRHHRPRELRGPGGPRSSQWSKAT
eukprot:5423075-Pyramimonas_sp.AAC.1